MQPGKEGDMRGPAIFVLLLAIGFVGYVVYSQIEKHAPPEEAAAPPADDDPAPRTEPTTGRPDGDGIIVPPEGDTGTEAEESEAVASEYDRALRRWLDRLRNGTDRESFEATVELGKLGDPEAIRELAEALRDHRDFYVRLGAATAIGSIGRWEGTDALVLALLDGEPLVRTAAAESLARITGHEIEGFRPEDGPARRGEWKRAWEQWIAANRPSDK